MGTVGSGEGGVGQTHDTHDKVLGWCVTLGRSAWGTQALSAAAPELCLTVAECISGFNVH